MRSGRIGDGAVLMLAGPLVVSGAAEAIFGLTDTWFIGRLSSQATAAMASVYWLDYCGALLLGGAAMSVQTFAAQAFGAGRYANASRAAWSGLAASMLAVPAFVALGFLAEPILTVAGIDADVRHLALAYWWPRFVVAEPIMLLVLSLNSFFNAISQTRRTLAITLVMGLANIAFNQLFIFGLRMGIAGSGWATAAAATLGTIVAFVFFLDADGRRKFRSHLTWRRPQLRPLFALGLPMGLGFAADFFVFAVLQLMVVRLGTAAGAAMQIVTMLNTIPYIAGLGIARAGVSLVGQAIGRRQPEAAMAAGNTVIRLAVPAMAIIGVLLSLSMPMLATRFVNTLDPNAQSTIALCTSIIWIATCFQIGDGLVMASEQCLRGAGDARVPAMLTLVLSWAVWAPLAHMLTFNSDNGWVHFLPQFGLGIAGAWWASVVYAGSLGVLLIWRWRSGVWMRAHAPTTVFSEMTRTPP